MSDSESYAAFVRTILGLYVLILSIAFVYMVLLLLGQWKTYKKLGLQPWACLIPVYTTWVLSNRLVKREVAIAATVTSAVALLLQYYYRLVDASSTVMYLIAVVALATLVFSCIIMDKLSKTFGYGTGFTVGLVLLPPVFYMILAYGSREPIDGENNIAGYLPSGTSGGYSNYYGPATADAAGAAAEPSTPANPTADSSPEENSPFTED